MSDVFDLFSEQPLTYSASLWLWKTTQGIVTLGGPRCPNIEKAEDDLRSYTGKALVFTRMRHDGDRFASQTYEKRVDLAVVIREDGEVVSHT